MATLPLGDTFVYPLNEIYSASFSIAYFWAGFDSNYSVMEPKVVKLSRKMCWISELFCCPEKKNIRVGSLNAIKKKLRLPSSVLFCYEKYRKAKSARAVRLGRTLPVGISRLGHSAVLTFALSATGELQPKPRDHEYEAARRVCTVFVHCLSISCCRYRIKLLDRQGQIQL